MLEKGKMIQSFLKFLAFSFFATVAFVVYYHHQVIINQQKKEISASNFRHHSPITSITYF